MNEFEINNLCDIKRHILGISAGIVGSFIPNNKSNSNSLLNGILFSCFIVKYLYGDLDKGYKWTFSDLIFWFFVIIEGFIGAYIIKMID